MNLAPKTATSISRAKLNVRGFITNQYQLMGEVLFTSGYQRMGDYSFQSVGQETAAHRQAKLQSLPLPLLMSGCGIGVLTRITTP
jgi:hypothetical protein